MNNDKRLSQSNGDLYEEEKMVVFDSVAFKFYSFASVMDHSESTPPKVYVAGTGVSIRISMDVSLYTYGHVPNDFASKRTILVGWLF